MAFGLALPALLAVVAFADGHGEYGAGGYGGYGEYGPDHDPMAPVEAKDIEGRAKGEFNEVRDFINRTYKTDPAKDSYLKVVDNGQTKFLNDYHAKLNHPPYKQWEFDAMSRFIQKVIKPQVQRDIAVQVMAFSKGVKAEDIDQKRQENDEQSERDKSAWVTHERLHGDPYSSQVIRLAVTSVGGTIPPGHDDNGGGGTPDNHPQPGGNGGHGGTTPNGGDSAGPTPNGSGGSGGATANGGTDLSKIIQQGASRVLAAQAGDELASGKYSDAYSDAKNALSLNPANQDALTVMKFSEGRASASGGGLAGGERGFAGGGQAAGGAATFGSAARGAAPAALTPSAAAGRFSSDQSRKAAENALKLGDMAGALAYANRGLSQDPNDPFMLNLRASIYARMKDYKQASADAAAGLALAPKNAALLRTKGYADLRNRDYKDAMGSANQLLELDPKDAYAYALRGHAYGSMGDRDAMMADLRRAAELDPRYQEALAQAGQLQAPSDSDILFLFPGEEGAKTANSAAPAGRNKKFGLLVGVSALGGLLLALGLLQTVLAPLKNQVSSVFTRLTRTGPSVASFGEAADTSQPASVNGLLPGLIRGQYEISRQIGQGGMGTVFEGTDRALGRRVAIKKMREELRVNPQERARFVIEAKTVAALHHPSIVDIYAIAEDGQDVFLVFEYVDGKTVHDLVQVNGRLAIPDAAKVVRAAADALGYAHSKGVIHRDMKPSNMMIDGGGRVKVMDFGIARMAKDAMTRYSMTNTVVGTPPYMAPEQEQGQVRRESDVYALAVCAYEMLTGKLPFIGIGAGMLMNKINMSYVPPSRAIAGLPETLDAVFMKAFQALPENRYRTPQEFADALESALGSGVRA